MKNTIKCFGIVTLVAVIGFAMAACYPDPEPDPEEGHSVTIKGKPEVGGKLTATSVGDNFSGDFVWTYVDSKETLGGTGFDNFWKLDSSRKEKIVSGVLDSEVTILPELSALVGKYIRVTRYVGSGSDKVGVSDVIGPVVGQ